MANRREYRPAINRQEGSFTEGEQGGAEEGAALSQIADVALGLLATVLLWTLVVGAFYGFTLVMSWLTSRIFRLPGRRRGD